MNTKIGTSFGLALLMAIGVIVTMLALGMFSAKPAVADHMAATVTLEPTKARAIAAYTIVFDGSTGANLEKGESITVTFNASTGVPSSIAASAIKLKTDDVAGGSGVADRLVSADAVTVSGKAITITVPDMDPDPGTGDDAIAAGATVTIIITQAAGIQNPNKHGLYDLDVKTTQDPVNAESDDYAIFAFVSFTPSSAQRGATVTISGGGFEKNCVVCIIRINPQNDPNSTPTTGNAGSGSINANGEFAGTFVPSSSTTSGFIWVEDSEGFSWPSSSTWTQSPGATPRVTTATPGSTVSVDLVDYTDSGRIATVVIGGDLVTTPFTNAGLSSSGGTTSLDPFKFVVPTGTVAGTYKVVITDNAGESASFSVELVIRVLTITPATAVPGQNITVSGTGFTKNGTIDEGDLTATAGGDTAEMNPSTDISISSTGAFDFATTLPTDEDFADTGSNAIKIEASDGTLEGSSTSSGFSRTPRTLTLSPSTASPGESVTVTVTGMTVDNNEAGIDENAEFTIEAVGLEFSGNTTFPINSDGAGTGSVTIPIGTDPSTILFTAEDNAAALNDDATENRSATANLVVPTGTVAVDPAEASTGNFITVSGSAFPPNSVGTALTFGGASAFPPGGFSTDSNGDFSVLVEVPPASGGGSLTPGTKIIKVAIGQVEGSTTRFAVPDPTIVITPSEVTVEDIATITGTGFDSLVTATALTIGNTVVMPSPAPRAGRNGDITAEILIPLFNPGVYIVVMSTGDDFSAAGTITVLAAGSKAASTAADAKDVFADVINNGDNLVRVWRYDNSAISADKEPWTFYDPKFEDASTLKKTGAGDIVWINVINEQKFQGQTLFAGWNLILLK
jgi:hypothetical protein